MRELKGVSAIAREVGDLWKKAAVPALMEYLRVPAISSAYDADWEAGNSLQDAAELLRRWCEGRPLAGLTTELISQPGHPPALVIDSPGDQTFGEDEVILAYGHYDKQPAMEEWSKGLGPFSPVVRGERLYGRGAADDGWSIFGVMCALEALERCAVPHRRVVAIMEGEEESGSSGFEEYLGMLRDRAVEPRAVISLDSGGPTDDRLWMVTSLRGSIRFSLQVEVLVAPVHSGTGGGIVPSSFRVARALLSRMEDENTGQVMLRESSSAVPEERRREAEALAEELSWVACGNFPVAEGITLGGNSPAERLLMQTWEPSLAVIGIDGIPPGSSAPAVLHKSVRVMVLMRTPPEADVTRIVEEIQEICQKSVPSNARAELEFHAVVPGWSAIGKRSWIDDALDSASREVFGRGAGRVGQGGTVPPVPILSAAFPDAEVVCFGVMGPDSNAHGPDESLLLSTAVGATVGLASLFRWRTAVEGGAVK